MKNTATLCLAAFFSLLGGGDDAINAQDPLETKKNALSARSKSTTESATDPVVARILRENPFLRGSKTTRPIGGLAVYGAQSRGKFAQSSSTQPRLSFLEFYLQQKELEYAQRAKQAMQQAKKSAEEFKRRKMRDLMHAHIQNGMYIFDDPRLKFLRRR